MIIVLPFVTQEIPLVGIGATKDALLLLVKE